LLTENFNANASQEKHVLFSSSFSKFSYLISASQAAASLGLKYSKSLNIFGEFFTHCTRTGRFERVTLAISVPKPVFLREFSPPGRIFA
jgi:hypothetical protein